MRPIRPAALPAAALSMLATAALVLGLAGEAEAAARPAVVLHPAPLVVGAGHAPFVDRAEVGRAAVFGPSQVVSDAASPEPGSDAAAPDPAVEAPAELGTAAIDDGTSGQRIEALQVRLTWVGTPAVPSTGAYDAGTEAAVEHFQAKHELPVTGRADRRTVEELSRVSRRGAELDRRCTSVPVAVCVDKTQKVLRYVRDGRVVRTLDANFGPEKGEEGFGTYSRTREGSFTVYRRAADHVSTGYGTPMRWSLFFDGAEAMHFSDYFRKGGYQIRSYGCIDIASFDGARWVFRHSPLGTPFIVYH
jgi:peptidoglycan hydrolase-like protein with peptidoglycan-binding domain